MSRAGFDKLHKIQVNTKSGTSQYNIYKSIQQESAAIFSTTIRSIALCEVASQLSFIYSYILRPDIYGVQKYSIASHFLSDR